MKRIFSIFVLLIFLLLSSCHTRVVDQQKPLQANTLELYEKYIIQTNDAKTIKMQLLKRDDEKLYGKTKTNENIVINKSEVREIKKLDLLSSIGIAVAAIAAVIFVPI